MRLDVYLIENKIYDSRTRAARAIKEGCVEVNGKIVVKSSENINENTDKIVCKEDPVPYVSRGALKLKFAIEKYKINVSGLTAVDIGASTGGFTEILLINGARSVACVDVGRGQLDEKLRKDKRCKVFEETDIRNFNTEKGSCDEEKFYDVAVTDVSFISIKMIVPHIYRLLKENGIAVILIKPQFEAGRRNLNKKGIVKDQNVRNRIVDEITEYIADSGFKIDGVSESPVKGGDGNIEFVCVCRRKIKNDV